VDAETGEERWRVATGELLPWPWGDEGWDVYLSSAVVQGNTVVFGSGDGAIYAVDLRSGRERWHVDTGGRIRSTPAIANGSVYVGSTDGVVYRLSLDDGSLEWRHETEGVTFDSGEFGFDRKSIIASPAVLDGIVYVGSRDGFMYMLDEATGDRLRRVSHEVSWAMSSPAVRDGAMFAGTSDGLFVHRVDVDTGEEVWRYVGAGYTWSSPALVGNTVYIGDGGGYLTAIDADTGAERWSFATGEGVYASPWVEDGVVYFGADDGAVYAVDGETPPVHRAVFWDEDLTSTYTALDHVAARVFFQLRGYQVLDAESLASFIEHRIDDGASSTVVFALPVIPPTVAAEPADTVLFRRYLEAGGKAVWLGLPPMSVVTDDSGQITGIDRERSGLLLGMDYSESNFDFYGSLPTALGRQWGLSSGWLSQYAHDVSDDIQVLGLDEHGRASAWVKNFGGPVGTGFVGFGLPEVTLEALEAARVLAEYGLGGTGR
jgi:outer membrane protein assembly factor BamB